MSGVDSKNEHPRRHKSQNSFGECGAPLGHAELEIVQQRIDMCGRDIRIGGEILRGIEGVRRHPPLLPAERRVVLERIDPGGSHVGVIGQVGRGREKRVRIAPLVPAEQIVVLLGATDNLAYRAHTNFLGADTLTMTTSDEGFAGILPQSDTDNVSINVGTLLRGTPGDDMFESLPGGGRIDAGAGNDTITFNFRLVDATVTYKDNKVIVDGPSSHMELTGFEKFVFTDGAADNTQGSRLIDDLYYYAHNHDVWNAHAESRDTRVNEASTIQIAQPRPRSRCSGGRNLLSGLIG